jgi:excinuclease ABC subunit B
MPLEVVSPFRRAATSPARSRTLTEGLEDGLRFQTLLGVTGSGKTFTMARLIEASGSTRAGPGAEQDPHRAARGRVPRPLPDAAVEFFISYYDYYQPEAYVPARDLFIEKDANINAELERLRHSTTRSLLTRAT